MTPDLRAKRLHHRNALADSIAETERALGIMRQNLAVEDAWIEGWDASERARVIDQVVECLIPRPDELPDPGATPESGPQNGSLPAGDAPHGDHEAADSDRLTIPTSLPLAVALRLPPEYREVIAAVTAAGNDGILISELGERGIYAPVPGLAVRDRWLTCINTPEGIRYFLPAKKDDAA